MKSIFEQATRKALEKKYRALNRDSNRADRICREISKNGWEWEIWESHRPGTCFAPQWRFEAWRMSYGGDRFGWVSARCGWMLGKKIDKAPLVVLGWSRLEVIERFHKMFVIPKDEI